MRVSRVTVAENYLFCCIAVLFYILFTGIPVSAHIEKGSMPDSVAEIEYRILLEFTPQDTATRSLLGMALLRQGKLAEAEKEFRLILQNDPKYFDALDGLGLLLFKQKRYSEALTHLLAAIKIHPNDVMVHLHLGQTLALSDRPDEAKEILLSGIKLLANQTSSKNNDQQLAEFKTALATLPGK